MKKIVIIGGCGYIGSKLFAYLTEKKYNVDTIDLEWFGNFVNPKNFRCDYKSLPKAFFDKYDVVILLAGHSTVGMCSEDILGSLKNNVENFVILMKKLKKQKFIYASTYRLYPKKLRLLKETDTVDEPRSTYDLTKKTIDNYMAFSPLEFYSLRMATVNGYSPNLRTNQIINKLFLDAKAKRKITLYDPLAMFSLLGIQDLCRAVEHIIEGPDRRGIYNLKSFDSNTQNLFKKVGEMYKDIAFTKIKSPNPHHIRIAADKFQKTYNFTFEETPESILTSLLKNYSKDSHLIRSK